VNVDTLLVADYANVTDNGKINVMGVFRRINAHQFPARHPEMYLIVGLSASVTEYDTNRKLTIKLLDPDSQEMMAFSREFRVPKGVRWQRAEMNRIIQLRDIVFPKAGTYEFAVLLDNDEKSRISIELVKIESKSRE